MSSLSTKTLDGARLQRISLMGSTMRAELADVCSKASLSIAVDKVTEMSMTFVDSPDLALFNARLFAPGTSINYGGWYLTCDGLALSTQGGTPQISINAPSWYVTQLRKQTGAKSWGDTPLTSWVAGVADSIGMAHLVQPGLGIKSIARVAPEDGQDAESTWDVLTQQAKEAGCWLFEYGATLVFAKPSYLVQAVWPRRTWALRWDSFKDYSEGMAGMPTYADDPSAELRESMTVRLVSPDADQARPGDAVVLTGRAVGPMGGTWIIRGVDFPLHVAGAVVLTLQRPIDPKVEPPRSDTSSSGSTGTTAAPKSGAASGGSSATGVAGAFDRFFAKYNGRAIDADGAFGAQCVDLTKRYASEVFRVNISGDGKDWYANGARSGAFRQVGAGAKALKGDIACWGSSWGGGYGHVAIVINDNGGNLSTMSQNPGPARQMNLGKNGLQGYLRPTKAV